MIEAKAIYKTFGQKQVLNNVSVSFQQGKTNLIIGQSGSGKTVLMKCLVGLYNIDSGKILYNNRDITSMPFKEVKKVRKEIGMLFQGGALFDSMTVEQNIIFPLDMFSKMTTEEKRHRANECLKRVNLENANKLSPSELSGGMNKRVAIARAIAMNPQYLFCDEPNSGLDPHTASIIDNLIREITHEYNMTTIINTHDMNSVMEIGEHVIYIHKGEVWWQGDNQEILATNNPELNEFVFSTELTRRLK